MPAREGRCTFIYVLLRIVTQAECEQFHQLAGVVFIRGGFPTFCQVEVEQHGRVAGNTEQDVVEGIEGMVAQKLVLVNHAHKGIWPTDFVKAACEYTMPE